MDSIPFFPKTCDANIRYHKLPLTHEGTQTKRIIIKNFFITMFVFSIRKLFFDLNQQHVNRDKG